jgi:hypothetical protein
MQKGLVVVNQALLRYSIMSLRNEAISKSSHNRHVISNE